MYNNMSSLLEVQDLRTYFFTKYGVVKAVDSVGFRVDRRETLGLVGESGCGKSITCLSILRLVPEPAGKIIGGKVIFEGEDLLRKSEAEMRHIRGRKISIILQDSMTSLNPAFSIGDQVAETVRLHQGLKGKSLWSKVVEALQLVRIPDAEVRVSDYPHQMSGGMRQRVSGAIALSCTPSLLIADEPTTSLDVTIQAQYLELLKRLQEEFELGMIFVTHDLGIVAQMCDKAAVMYAGKIVEMAATQELFQNPMHPYTVGLLKCVPKLGARMTKLATIEGQPPNLVNMGQGCSFAPRCSQAMEICRAQSPGPVLYGKDHLIQCWKASQ